MKLLKQIQLLVVLSVLCCACFGAEEPCEPAKQGLKFNVSDKPWSSHFPGSGKSTHVACVQLRNMKDWPSKWVNVTDRRQLEIRDWHGAILRVEFQDEGAVEGPRDFVILSNFRRRSKQRGSDEEFYERRSFEESTALGLPIPASEEMWLYAESAEQAQELAKAFIERVSGLAYIRVRKEEARLEYLHAQVARFENEIRPLENELKPFTQKMAVYEKTTYYRNKDDAQRSILQWNTLLNQVEVDIIGIKAKLDKIKQFTKTERKDYLLASLHSMKMAEEVELAGALARKNAAQSHREKALAFLDLAEKAEELEHGLRGVEERLSWTRKEVAKLEKQLSQMKTEIKPVEVVNNEVTIYPLASPQD